MPTLALDREAMTRALEANAMLEASCLLLKTLALDSETRLETLDLETRFAEREDATDDLYHGYWDSQG